MEKADERRQLRRIFGALSDSFRDFERPDFLYDLSSSRVLGVEVTSFYASNADAKLKQIPGYASSLIDRSRRPHRGDVRDLQVDEVTLLNPDGSVVDRLTAVIQEMPSAAERVDLLFTRIADKESKIDEYLRSSDQVDVVLLDASNLFHHETHEQFYRLFNPLAPKERIVSSRFREINLLTTTSKQTYVYIPLVANTFFADCFAYEHLLKSEIDAGRSSREIFQLLAACLLHEGYSRVKVSAGKGGVGFFCGAWEIFYAEDGKKLRDWNLLGDPHPGESLEEAIADASTEVLELAGSLAPKRRSLFSAVDVRLPAHEA